MKIFPSVKEEKIWHFWSRKVDLFRQQRGILMDEISENFLEKR